jgi:hypothetical protein
VKAIFFIRAPQTRLALAATIYNHIKTAW